jgi:hypothetical protein
LLGAFQTVGIRAGECRRSLRNWHELCDCGNVGHLMTLSEAG